MNKNIFAFCFLIATSGIPGNSAEVDPIGSSPIVNLQGQLIWHLSDNPNKDLIPRTTFNLPVATQKDRNIVFTTTNSLSIPYSISRNDELIERGTLFLSSTEENVLSLEHLEDGNYIITIDIFGQRYYADILI